MQTPKWKLFVTLWCYTVLCWVFPYALHRLAGFNVQDAFTSYPWNFSPLYAVSLFGGAYLASPAVACLLPAAVYMLANVAIWALTGHRDWAFTWGILANCAVFTGLPLWGMGLGRRAGLALLPAAMGRGVAAAVTFFVVSNFLVFCGGIYPHTVAGLVHCYSEALAFFPMTVLSTLLFTAVLFSPIGVGAPVRTASMSGEVQ